MLTLYEARLLDCQHLSRARMCTHTRTHIHTYTKMRCPFTHGLSKAAILPSGGICVLLVREWGIEVGALMNNAAVNEIGDDGDRSASSQELVYMYFAVI